TFGAPGSPGLPTPDRRGFVAIAARGIGRTRTGRLGMRGAGDAVGSREEPGPHANLVGAARGRGAATADVRRVLERRAGDLARRPAARVHAQEGRRPPPDPSAAA